MRVFTASLVTVVAVALPAKAHNQEELDIWQADWVARAEISLSPQLWAEWEDMASRHPGHLAYRDPNQPVAVKKASPRQYSGMGSDVEAWRGLVAAYFPSSAVDRMLCIMDGESGGNPNAKNPRSSARGLFQILGSLWGPHFGVSQDSLYDPDLNVKLARAIWDQQGYGAWNSDRFCR